MSATREEQPGMTEALGVMATLDVIDPHVCMLTMMGQVGLDILLYRRSDWSSLHGVLPRGLD